ncbi:MAG: lipopolysaccharide biosynthesis protein [Bacteroidales bacterium]|nr:lipopolysaccharide biosynthesis protein [Bacteroidales bacterium]
MGIVARQSIKGSLANYLGVAIGFFTTFFVVTKCLTQEEIGLTRVLVDAATLFAAFAQLGTNSSIIKFFPYFADGKRNRGIFGWSVLLPLVGFTLVAAVLLLFRGEITEVYSERAPLIREYFYLLLPLTFFMLYLTVFETNANVLMRITVPRLVREVGIRVITLVCYVLYGYRVIGFELFVVLFTCAYGLAMLLNLFYLLKLGHVSFRIDLKSVDRRVLSDMVRYSLFMTVIVLASNTHLVGSLFIGAKEGLALTGVYTIAFFIANVVDVPYRSLGAISRPVVAAAVKEDDWEGVSTIAKKVSLHQFLVSTVILLLIWINLEALFEVIPNGEEYKGGKWVVLILGLARVVNSTCSISIDVLNYSKRYRMSLVFVLVLTIGMVMLNYWLVGVWSINGAAAAAVFAYLAYYICLLSYNQMRLGVSIFSAGELKVVVVVALGLALGMGWSAVVTPLLPDGIVWTLADAAIKTTIVAVAVAVTVYKMKISENVNEIMDKAIVKLRGRKQ